MESDNILAINVPNIISITVMGLVGAVVLGLALKAAGQAKQNANPQAANG